MSEVQTKWSVLNAWCLRSRLIKLPIQTGPDLSGKTTLFKQMQIVYADGFPLKEKREYRIVILDNLLVAFNMAIEEMKKRCFEYERTASIVRSGLR